MFDRYNVIQEADLAAAVAKRFSKEKANAEPSATLPPVPPIQQVLAATAVSQSGPLVTNLNLADLPVDGWEAVSDLIPPPRRTARGRQVGDPFLLTSIGVHDVNLARVAVPVAPKRDL